jgi:hypothetical protein
VGNRNDELRREQAYQDYKNLERYGRKVNRNQLYDWYCSRLKEDPSVRPLIPTTSRGILYKWFEEDKWEERLSAERRQEQLAEQEEFGILRKKALGQLYILSDDAVKTLHKIIKAGKSERDQIEAIKIVLRSIGIVEQTPTRVGTQQTPAQVQEMETPPLPVDDSDAALTEWLNSYTGNRNTT